MTFDDTIRYALDTNVFIEAHRKYYAFDICPGFWTLIEQQARASKVLSIDRVKAEIAGGDPLANWAQATPPLFFQSTTDPAIQQEFAQLMRWVNDMDYTLAAKAKFAGAADGWLVAFSKAMNITVVTLEQPNPARRNDVPIPVLCDEFSVQWTDPFTMLRSLGASFA